MIVVLVAAGWLGVCVGFVFGSIWVARTRDERVDALMRENERLRRRLGHVAIDCASLESELLELGSRLKHPSSRRPPKSGDSDPV